MCTHRPVVNVAPTSLCSALLQSEQNLHFLPRIPSVSNLNMSTETSRSDTAKLTTPLRPSSNLIPLCPTCLFNTRCFPFQYLSIWRDCRVLTISTGFTAVSWLISVNTRMRQAPVRAMGSGLSGSGRHLYSHVVQHLQVVSASLHIQNRDARCWIILLMI